MSKVQRFEDLEVWQKAIELATRVYKISNKQELQHDYGMKRQIRRAAISISSNIAEGFEYNNNKDFIRYLRYAKGSAGELRGQFYILYEAEIINKPTFNQLYQEVEKLSKQLNRFINYLEQYLYERPYSSVSEKSSEYHSNKNIVNQQRENAQRNLIINNN